jgi:hypothetical protein
MTATPKPGDRVRLVGEFIVNGNGYHSTEDPAMCLGLTYAARLGFTVEVIAPALPPEPPIGSVVVLRLPDGNVAGTRHWEVGGWGGYGTWANVCAAGTIAAVVEPEVTA